MSHIIDTSSFNHNPIMETITDYICTKQLNFDKSYFRAVVVSQLATMASCMRVTISSKADKLIPVNVYTLALAHSGYGKGVTLHLLDDILAGFNERFKDLTFPYASERNLNVLTNRIAANSSKSAEEIMDEISAQYYAIGGRSYQTRMSDATVEAVRQLHQMLVMANAGCINLCMDEIGSVYDKAADIMTLFVELYDCGKMDYKVTKNTKDNQRGREFAGDVPANLLMFGAPTALLDGGKREDKFYQDLQNGLARRLMFAYGKANQGNQAIDTYTPAERFALRSNAQNTAVRDQMAKKFMFLADPMLLGKDIEIPDDIAIYFEDYHGRCISYAESLPNSDSEQLKKLEVTHRYFKAMKLAGLYAFLDKSSVVTKDHADQAIKLVEESGENFQKILFRPAPKARLAIYLSKQDEAKTFSDIEDDLNFFKNLSKQNKMTLMVRAAEWGLKNNILVQMKTIAGTDRYSAKTLEKTSLDDLIISYSGDLANGYQNGTISWDELKALPTLSKQDDGVTPMHWLPMHCDKGHRCDESIIPGFHLIVLDVDSGFSIKAFQSLFSDYKYILYTTKRHTPELNRYRVIFPMNFKLELDKKTYKAFMDNILEWVPFEVDPGVDQISRKWETNPKNTQVISNEGELFDCLPFIPYTSENERFQQGEKKIASLNNLEKWFAREYAEGNRNNILYRYAMVLFDAGNDLVTIEQAITDFNKAQEDPLPEDEIKATVMAQIAKKVTQVTVNNSTNVAA